MTDNDTDTKPLHGPNLILDVENFGPIAEAKNIEFRPMTVFVGPSNTGKSYLAMLLHAMLQAHRSRHHVMPAPYLRALMSLQESSELDRLFSEVIDIIANANEHNLDAGDISIQFEDYSVQSQRRIIDLLHQRKRDIANFSAREVTDFFDVDSIESLRRGFETSDSEMSVRMSDHGRNWHIVPGSGTFVETNKIRTMFKERFAVGLSRDLNVHPLIELQILQSLIDGLNSKFVGVVDSLYFPAARTGLLTIHRMATNALLKDAHQFVIDGEVAAGTIYHRASRDFLQLVNDVVEAQRARRVSPNGDAEEVIAARIEDAVLDGQVRVDDAEFGPPDFNYFPRGWKSGGVPVNRASSMVTEIAPIVSFLRAYVEVGDLLIIEEPEAHLHPSAQQRMAAILAYMVRQGFRVLITTHSHYMVEAMGMFTCAAGIDTDARSRSMRLLNNGGDDMDRDLYLNENEVSVYSFDPHGVLGTRVRQVPFDSQSYAFEPEDYSTALLDQFNRISRVVNERIDIDELA